jgi:hypothetical protein
MNGETDARQNVLFAVIGDVIGKPFPARTEQLPFQSRQIPIETLDACEELVNQHCLPQDHGMACPYDPRSGRMGEEQNPLPRPTVAQAGRR